MVNVPLTPPDGVIAEGIVEGIPDNGFCAVGHAIGSSEPVRVHEINLPVRRVHLADGPAIGVNVIRRGSAVQVVLGQKLARSAPELISDRVDAGGEAFRGAARRGRICNWRMTTWFATTPFRLPCYRSALALFRDQYQPLVHQCDQFVDHYRGKRLSVHPTEQEESFLAESGQLRTAGL